VLSRERPLRRLAHANAKALPTERLRDTFEAGRRHDVLRAYFAERMTAMQVNRESYGEGNQMNNITVVIHGPARDRVMSARLFPACEIEWRPQSPREHKATPNSAPARQEP
jgi:hypothetical protein